MKRKSAALHPPLQCSLRGRTAACWYPPEFTVFVPNVFSKKLQKCIGSLTLWEEFTLHSKGCTAEQMNWLKRHQLKWSKRSNSTGSGPEVHKEKILKWIERGQIYLGMFFSSSRAEVLNFLIARCAVIQCRSWFVLFMLSFRGPPLRKKTQLRKVKRTLDIEERMLFHGTGHSNIQAICTFNFDWRLTGSHGDVYGKGRFLMLHHETLRYSPVGLF